MKPIAKGQVLHVHHGDIVRYNFGKFVTFAFLHLCYVDLIGLIVTDYL
jgi:hypothetical protein